MFELMLGVIYLCCFMLFVGIISSDLGGYYWGFIGVFQISIVVLGGQGIGVVVDIIVELGQQFFFYSELFCFGFFVQVVSLLVLGFWILGDIVDIKLVFIGYCVDIF